MTEIYDYLRLLFARIGKPYCPKCGKPISQQTIDQMVDKILELPLKTKILIMAQLVREQKGEHRKVIENVKKAGYVRVRIDGEVLEINDDISLKKNQKHTIEVVVDRLIIREGIARRLADSLETALKLAEGVVYVQVIGGELMLFSQNFACVECGISFPPITPRMFSFNAPYGACPECGGIGSTMEFNLDFVVPDAELSFADGVFAPISKKQNSYTMCQIAAVLGKYGCSIDDKWKNIPQGLKEILLYGTDEPIEFGYENLYGDYHIHRTKFEGIMNILDRRYKETISDDMRKSYENYMSVIACSKCRGMRLKPEVLSIKIQGKNIYEVSDMAVSDCLKFFKTIKLTEQERKIAALVLKEIEDRLTFLINVGLDYLSLNRTASTLSGGEAQRIRLATQVGSGLVGVLYILDEPSIGLHQRDNAKLISELKHLRDLGNTLIVVEHDEETMYAADQIIDVGPGAGIYGGRIIAQGTVDEIKKSEASITGQYLSGKKKILVPDKRRGCTDKYIEIIGAAENNLKNISLKIPLGIFVAVTGVSGSGKSTLINEILYKGIEIGLYGSKKTRPGKYTAISGLDNIDKVINIDQSPIGRTPRSNPATYTGVFDLIRELFAQTNEAKMRGYKAGRFSFNVKGGRCEACSGDGIKRIEMHFLPDVYVPCEVCSGARYNRETLEVKYKGKSITDILNMSVSDAVVFFQNVPKIYSKLKVIEEVGLGYITLGQSATTLSGGEAQRVKLATELSHRTKGRTLYILDEPTTGLHMDDIAKLLDILQRLVDNGNTVIVIEHNLDVIKVADYIIDLGPEGGNSGGRVIATGTPEEIASCKQSYTGVFLKKLLG